MGLSPPTCQWLTHPLDTGHPLQRGVCPRLSKMLMLLLHHLSTRTKLSSHGSRSRIASLRSMVDWTGMGWCSLYQNNCAQSARNPNREYYLQYFGQVCPDISANCQSQPQVSQVGTHVANDFLLATASCGNVQRNVSAYEAGGGSGNTDNDYVIEEVRGRQ
jgi:hypothetical protein